MQDIFSIETPEVSQLAEAFSKVDLKPILIDEASISVP
jgi:hypothetical protein